MSIILTCPATVCTCVHGCVQTARAALCVGVCVAGCMMVVTVVVTAALSLCHKVPLSLPNVQPVKQKQPGPVYGKSIYHSRTSEPKTQQVPVVRFQGRISQHAEQVKKMKKATFLCCFVCNGNFGLRQVADTFSAATAFVVIVPGSF